jgi:hypothetical protein
VETLRYQELPMSIITRPRPPVKPTRNAPRHTHPFGEGIRPARRARFVPSAEDMPWAAETSPFADERYDVIGSTDADLDFAAGCAMAQVRMDAGFSLF